MTGVDSDQINFLNGIARRCLNSWVLSFPWTKFFDGARSFQKAVGHCQAHGAQLISARFSLQRGCTARAMVVFKVFTSPRSCLFSVFSWRRRCCSAMSCLPIPGRPAASSPACLSHRSTVVSPRLMSWQISSTLKPCFRIICTTGSLNSALNVLRFLLLLFLAQVGCTYPGVRRNLTSTLGSLERDRRCARDFCTLEQFNEFLIYDSSLQQNPKP